MLNDDIDIYLESGSCTVPIVTGTVLTSMCGVIIYGVIAAALENVHDRNHHID